MVLHFEEPMKEQMINNFKKLEVCEALGEDNKWYTAKIIQQNEDGTFSCELPKYQMTWQNVFAHNLRKLHNRLLPRDLSGDEIAKKPSAPARKKRKVMFDETFSEFDERPPKEVGGSTLPKGSVVTVSEKRAVKEELSIQIDNVLDDYRRIHRALSSIGASEFSESGPQGVAAAAGHGRVKVTITREHTAERKLTIKLPESPVVGACANPFSWFFKKRSPSKSKKLSGSKSNQKYQDKSSLEETIQEDVRRGSNLVHSSSKTDWDEEDLHLYKQEIQAEINRLRNASSVYTAPRSSDTSFADAYMSLSRFRLSNATLPESDSHRRRPENVVWLPDGTMIRAEARERGATYYLEDPTLQPGLLPYTKRLQLSNQWDVDSTMISSQWVEGDKVEVWLGAGWIPATIQNCVIENNMSKLHVKCNLSDDCHTVSRFGTQIRPWGYLELDSEDESESD